MTSAIDEVINVALAADNSNVDDSNVDDLGLDDAGSGVGNLPSEGDAYVGAEDGILSEGSLSSTETGNQGATNALDLDERPRNLVVTSSSKVFDSRCLRCALLTRVVSSMPTFSRDHLCAEWLQSRIQSPYSKIFCTDVVSDAMTFNDLPADAYMCFPETDRQRMVDGMVRLLFVCKVSKILIIAYDKLGSDVTSDTIFDHDWTQYHDFVSAILRLYTEFEFMALSDLALYDIHTWLHTRDQSAIARSHDDVDQQDDVHAMATITQDLMRTTWNTLHAQTEGFDRRYDAPLLASAVDTLRAISFVMVELDIYTCF
ncbi:hypothetical protein HKX48_002418 [Thoreauomyces humboldtii]|nr:hypothetical protein HKX48_002418 [Thoreauomyces humboldtii]